MRTTQSLPSKAPENALIDILHNVELAHSFVADYDSFCADRRTVYAVSRCLGIISEACRRLPIELKKRHSDVPWKEMAYAGDVRRHYEDLLEQVVWQNSA